MTNSHISLHSSQESDFYTIGFNFVLHPCVSSSCLILGIMSDTFFNSTLVIYTSRYSSLFLITVMFSYFNHYSCHFCQYSPTVLIHFAYPLPMITYKNRWELRTSVYMLEERTHHQWNHQKEKPKYNKRAHTNRRKGKPRASRQGGQRDHTTEPYRIPTIEVHPTKTASKAQNQELLKQTKKVT